MPVSFKDMLPNLFYSHPMSNEYYMRVGDILYYFSYTNRALRPALIMPKGDLFTKLNVPW